MTPMGTRQPLESFFSNKYDPFFFDTKIILTIDVDGHGAPRPMRINPKN